MASATRARTTTARGGIDLGGTKVEAIVVDPGNNVLGSARRPTPTDGPSGVAAELVRALGDACEAAGTQASSLRGVCVGSPRGVDAATGEVRSARNLVGWDGT